MFNCHYFLGNLFEVKFFYLLAFIILLLSVLITIKFSNNVIGVVGLTLLYAGGLHNIFQRVMYNCVLDQLSFFGMFRFNHADTFVTVGIAFLILGVLKNEQ